MNKTIEREERAFTIIEILVVISLIAILAGLLLPAIAGAKRQSQIAIANTVIKNLQTALQQYFNDTGQYPLDQIDISSQRKKRDDVNTAWEITHCAGMVEGLDGDNFMDKGSPYFEFKSVDFDEVAWEYMYLQERNEASLLDPWGSPYRYRQNYNMNYKRGKEHGIFGEVDDPDPSSCIFNFSTFDLWSVGPDGQQYIYNQSIINDDICNWDY